MVLRKRKSPERRCVQDFGGDKRDRTADLLNAIQALSQAIWWAPFDGLGECLPVQMKHHLKAWTL